MSKKFKPLLKSFVVYRTDREQNVNLSIDVVSAAISQMMGRNPQGLEPKATGFVSPFYRADGDMVHAAGGNYRICLETASRSLPAAAIRQAAKEVIEQREAESGQPLSKKDKKAVLEAVRQKMMPMAPIVTKRQQAIIYPKDGLIIVEATSHKGAEQLTAHLRSALSSLPITPWSSNVSPSTTMAGWMADQPWPEGVVLGDEVQMVNTAEKGNVVRYKAQDLKSEEITNNFLAGKTVTEIRLDWRERFSFSVTAALNVRGLKALSGLSESIDGDADAAAKFDSENAVFIGELKDLVDDLEVAFE